MIGYVCKYTPIDLIEYFGEDTHNIEPSLSNFCNADSMLHPNLCPYSKGVLEDCYKKGIKNIVLTNCCDSIRRLYDVMKKDPFFNFVYMLDIPRKNNLFSRIIFKKALLNFIKSLEKLLNKNFNYIDFKNYLNNKTNKNVNKQNSIVLLGARCEESISKYLDSTGYNILNLSCNGIEIDYSNFNHNSNNIINDYVDALLSQFPCMRMVNTQKRLETLKNNKNIKGIIYHTIKFCDYYSFEYADIKNIINIPMLKLETDFSNTNNGQIKTRLEAFFENLNKNNTSLKKSFYNENNLNTKNKYINNDFVVAGIDIGSTSTNVVLLNKQKKILSYSIVKTGAKSIEGANNALNLALNKINLSNKDIKYIVSTGYGRVSIPFSDKEVTEITCHGKGAYFLNENTRTIIDIGGQDSKALSLDSNGNIKDFVMNDKCAAGTGRFLENMCKILEIPINDMGELSLKYKNDLTITSMCTVFAESEIVSLIAQNKETADIVHGICKSISSRVISLVNRVGKNKEFMMTGGVAKNIGVVKCLEKILQTTIYVPEEPQIVGALGAALIALESVENIK